MGRKVHTEGFYAQTCTLDCFVHCRAPRTLLVFSRYLLKLAEENHTIAHHILYTTSSKTSVPSHMYGQYPHKLSQSYLNIA